VLRFLVWAILAALRPKALLVSENLCLWQQLLVLQRRHPRPRTQCGPAVLVGKTLELQFRAEADNALNSLLLTIVAKVAFTVTALLFCLAQGHRVMLRFFGDWGTLWLQRNQRGSVFAGLCRAAAIRITS
jgi:hypothetical protein